MIRKLAGLTCCARSRPALYFRQGFRSRGLVILIRGDDGHAGVDRQGRLADRTLGTVLFDLGHSLVAFRIELLCDVVVSRHDPEEMDVAASMRRELSGVSKDRGTGRR